MADRDSHLQGENSRQPSQTSGENVVSSSTSVEMESLRDEEHLGAESLPQTYLGSPAVMPHSGHVDQENLPQTAITTIHATVPQSSHAVPVTHVLAVQQFHGSAGITTAHTASERLIYVNDNVPSHINPAVMTQSDYVVVSQPIDVSRMHAIHTGGESGNAVGGCESQGSDILGVNVLNTGDTSRVGLSQTSDISRINAAKSVDMSRTNVSHISDVSVMNTSQTGDISRISVPTSSNISQANVTETNNVSRVDVMQSGDFSRVGIVNMAPVDITKMIASPQAANVHVVDLRYSEPEDTKGNIALIGDPSRVGTLQTVDVSRMTLPQLQDFVMVNTQQAVETKPIILPQTSDVRRVDLSQNVDVSGNVLPPGEAGIQTIGMSIDQSANVIRISLPPTGDERRLAGPQPSDVGISHTSEISMVQLPQTADVNRMILPQTGDVGLVKMQQKVDDSKVIVTQSGSVNSAEAIQKPNLRRLIAYQGDVNTSMSMSHHSDPRVIESQQKPNTGNMVILKTGDSVNRINVHAVDSSVLDTSGKSDVSRMGELRVIDGGRVSVPGTEISVTMASTTNAPRMVVQQPNDDSRMTVHGPNVVSRMSGVKQSEIVSRMTAHSPNMVSRMSAHSPIVVSKVHNPSVVSRTSAHSPIVVSKVHSPSVVSRMSAHSPNVVGRVSAQQANNVSGVNVLQPGVGRMSTSHSEAINLRMQQPHDINRVTVHHVDNTTRVTAPDSTKSETSTIKVQEAVHASRMHRSVDNSMNISRTDFKSTVVSSADVNRMLVPQYTDSNAMTLPQTSDVGNVSAPHADDAPGSSKISQAASTDAHRLTVPEQQSAEYINMRMMAEAAEIMSRSSVPADDINMRLMAETADYVSRNEPQTVAITTAGSVADGGDMNAKIITQTHDSGTFRTPQSDGVTPAMMLTAQGVQQQNQHKMSSVTAKNMTTAGSQPGDGVPPLTMARTILQQSQSKAPVTGKEKEMTSWSGTVSQSEHLIVPGFRAEFRSSPSYSLWKDIGIKQGLHSDEEIASFLMKYYENTSGIFPSGSTTCTKCHQQFTISCGGCQQGTTSSGDASRPAEHHNTGKQEATDDRTKLWKLILEAGSKEEEEEKVKEDSAEKQSRRKPKKTQRVLRKRQRESAVKSSDESEDEKNPPACSSEPAPTSKSPSEEQEQPKLSQMVTRKRGRPSKESYQQASTLECPGCQRKFHTSLGLEQHIKLKRCKASKSGGITSKDEQGKKLGDKTPTSFHFKCDDCNKEYRSKQGLMLHRISKHDEVSDKDQSAQSGNDDGDDGEDTDEYVPYQKDKSPATFECPECHKQYRSKQGLMLHKASKHSEVSGKKIKLEEDTEETKEEVSVEGRDSSKVESLTLECKECKKKYTSRPGYMLHMKTKHSPQVFLQCPECENKFKTKVELRIHIRRNHNKGRLVLFCPYCPEIFHDRDVLKKHMDENHKTCRRVLFDCFACELQFSSRIERKRHIQSEHKGKDTSLTCHYCGSWFATRFEYDVHVKEGHPDQNQSWLCATCGDSFPTRYLLQRHTLCHKEKVHCELCNKSITEPCFEDHMKRHYGNKTWKCEMCPKAFIRKAELQQHTLVHKDERPFCCELCGVRYREKSRLNSHMRTHTGVKPYKCSQCDKAFTRSRELKNHMRVHTGEKPFSCTVCGRKFASSGNLSAHRRKVHKLDPIPHGQQSRKHTLEESIKPENVPPPLMTPPAVVEPRATQVVASLELPAAHNTSLEVPLAHNPAAQEAPAAHSSSLVPQAPVAHQAPIAHQDSSVVYQQHMIPKYEPLVTQPEHYIPPSVIQQPQSSLPVYWPNSSYGEES